MAEKQIPIFVINLDRSPERLRLISERLAQLNLSFERVVAVDGQKIDSTTRDSINPKRIWHHYRDCEVACYLSHLKALGIIASRQIPRAIILEDDAVFDSDFALWADPACPLPDGVELLKLEGSRAHNAYKIPIAQCANRTIQFSYKPSGGAIAYSVTLGAAKQMLKKLTLMTGWADYDVFAYWKTGICTYEINPFPAWHAGEDPSTIVGAGRRRTLSHQLTRNIFKRWEKTKRAVYVLRKFGIRPLLLASLR